MTTYQQIKENYEKNINNLIDKHKAFFAFSNEQLEKSKKKIGVKDNKDLISIGVGGFIKIDDAENFLNDAEEATKNYKKELKEAKEIQEQAILSELNNYEAFYTGDIDEVIEYFKGIYTKEAVKKVYLKNLNK